MESMTQEALIGLVVVLSGSVGGFILLVAGIVRRNANKEHSEQDVRREILRMLSRILAISEHLEDVLNHPADTEFAIHDLREEHKQHLEELEKIERMLKQIINMEERK